MSVAGELSVILLLTLANGVFAGAEIAMLSVRKARLVARAEQGQRGARVALSLREHPERFLATVQVGITVVSATAAAFGGATLARQLAPAIGRLGAGTELAEDLAIAAVVALVSTLSIVLGELVPKSLALRHAERVTLVAAPAIGAVAWLARPVVWLLTALSNLVLRPFGDRTSFGEARLSPEELQQLVEEAASEGAVDREAGELASRALDLPASSVDVSRVPRGDVVSLRHAHLREDLAAALLRAPHDRYPVVERDLDDAIGYLVVREVAGLLTDPLADLAARIRPTVFVPESRGALDVMREMQRTATHLMFVVDEQGVATGIVTLDDVLEELVGEILSEGEPNPHSLQREPDGAVLASGRAGIHEINRQLGLDLPERLGVATIAGLVIARAGRIPAPGALITIDRATFEVVEASAGRVLSLRIRIAAPAPRAPLDS